MLEVWGGSGGGVRLGPAGPNPLPQARLLARIHPVAPVEIGARGNLTAMLFDQTIMLTPRHCSMALAVAYVVFPVGEEPHARFPGQHADRVRAFVRWGIGYPPDAQGAPMLARRASRHIRQAYSDASAALRQYYRLEPQVSGALDAQIQAEIVNQRVVELPYRRWDANTGWLAPMQLQPTLDLLLRQPRFAAIQFSVALPPTVSAPADSEDQEGQSAESEGREEHETLASIELRSAARPVAGAPFHVRATALGAATRHEALRLLAKELCGRGALVIPHADRPQPPGVRATPPTDEGDRLRVARNLLGPAAESSNPAERISYTRDEAVTLFPLPFKVE